MSSANTRKGTVPREVGNLYFGYNKTFVILVSSNIRYDVLMINDVELGFASPNITDHEHTISNFGLHLVQQICNVGFAW